MGLRAVSMGQETHDNLREILGNDGIAVELMAGENTDGAGEPFRRYRCTSDEGGEIILCIAPSDGSTPLDLLCTLEFAGWSFLRKHDRLYHRVADRLEELTDSAGTGRRDSP